MGNWRKQQGESHQQVGQWKRSYYRKPPLDNWKLTVPSWEKEFCASVGLVPWRKLLETKKYMYLHDNVVKWDDSAGKEAFDNAKTRYWAQMKGFPCSLSLPDPNIYIDDIDWDSSVDPELVLDLEKEPKPSSEEGGEETVVILGSSLYLNQSFSCTGWGDAEEELPKAINQIPAAQGWGSDLHTHDKTDFWQQPCVPDGPAREYEWQNHGWNDSWGWNPNEHYGSNLLKVGKGRVGGNWGRWDTGNNRKNENTSWHKTPPYHGDDYQMSRGRWNYRGQRRGSFAYERADVDRIPLQGK